MRGAQRGPAWAKACIGFNDAVLAYLEQTPSIRTVVLSSAIVQYLPGAEIADPRGIYSDGERLAEVPLSDELVMAGLLRSAERIRKAGRRVVFVAPPPSTGQDTDDA